MRDILEGKPEAKIEFKPKVFECVRSVMALDKIDGRLDKPFWAQTRFSEEFEDILWNNNAKKPYKATRVKLLFDDDALYIGAYLYDDRLWATAVDNGAETLSDNGFEVFLDPDGDCHNYHSIAVTPLNTLRDVIMSRPPRDKGTEDVSVLSDGIKTAVCIDGNLNDPSSVPLNRGWSLEIKIPWRCVMGESTYLHDGSKAVNPQYVADAPLPGDVWRANFSRIDWLTEIRENRYSKVIDPEKGKGYIFDRWAWSPIGTDNMHMPELWGYIHFQNAENTLPSYTPDATEQVKWLMRRLYYRQKYYFAEKKQYASDYASLCGGWAEIDAAVTVTPQWFEATSPVIDGKRITVYADGLITVKERREL